MRIAPCKRSALWNDVRFEGLDLVRRWRVYPVVDLASGLLGIGVMVVGRRLSGRRAARSLLDCPAGIGSRTALRLREASLWDDPWLLEVETERPRRPRFHIRPNPYHTNPTIHFISLPTKYAHQRTKTETAMQKRIGSTVNVQSHASKQAKTPNVIVLSRNPGKSRKFFSRSNFTALDSYGISLV